MRDSPSDAQSFPRPPRSRAWSGGSASSERKRRQVSASVCGSSVNWPTWWRWSRAAKSATVASGRARPRPSTVSPSGRTAERQMAAGGGRLRGGRDGGERRGHRRVLAGIERDAARRGLAGAGERRHPAGKVGGHRLERRRLVSVRESHHGHTSSRSPQPALPCVSAIGARTFGMGCYTSGAHACGRHHQEETRRRGPGPGRNRPFRRRSHRRVVARLPDLGAADGDRPARAWATRRRPG